MAYPGGLHVIDRWGDRAPSDRGTATTVVLVHGSLDRAESFRRVARRLPNERVVAYDRRGYHRSRTGTAGLAAHVADLLAVTAEAAGGGPAVAVGHSFGSDVVAGAALADPSRFEAVGMYEAPMPWLGFFRNDMPTAPPPPEADPSEAVEHFFRRMVGDAAWERLSPASKQERLLDGPALLGDQRILRGPAPFDITALRVPLVVGRSSHAVPHHRGTVEWLIGHVPGATLYEIEGAPHGAHLSHPDHFAGLVRAVLARTSTDEPPAADELEGSSR